MELYSYFRSSTAYRVRIALNLKGIDYKYRGINVLKKEHRSEEYLAIHPQGLLPTLVLADGAVLTQTNAILEYIEETYPDPPLLPSDPLERAKVRAWASNITCEIHSLNNLRALNYLLNEFNITQEQKLSWYQHWILEGFAPLEEQILAAPYCNGEEITVADLYLIPQIFNALRYETDMTAFPKIMSVYEACNKLDAFERAAPANQPDAF